ncbi:hypothetical protein [Bradyrhizobium sp. LMG 9283]|uniref:hypothetical protein n=1 Tax=Bradyrhizobium sp. LMG 9283 TaxID=592064 RepID=UPI00388EB035
MTGGVTGRVGTAGDVVAGGFVDVPVFVAVLLVFFLGAPVLLFFAFAAFLLALDLADLDLAALDLADLDLADLDLEDLDSAAAFFRAFLDFDFDVFALDLVLADLVAFRAAMGASSV